MKNIIATRRLTAESKETGARHEVVIRIGEPYWIEDDVVAACPVQYEGLLDEFRDRQGIDMMQALQIATDIDPILRAMSDEFLFFWPTGELYEIR